MSLRLCFRHVSYCQSLYRASRKSLPRVPNVVGLQSRCMSDKLIDPEDHTPPIPEYQDRGEDEAIETRRARLLYQSRKRGMTENGLLLSTFADLHLDDLTTDQLRQYDSLINKPTNDWEIYYWMTANKPTPPEYDNAVMDMLKEHAQNKNRDVRLVQPELKSNQECV